MAQFQKIFFFIVVMTGGLYVIWYSASDLHTDTLMPNYRWFQIITRELSTDYNTNATFPKFISRKSSVDRETRFGGFQLVSDNATYVYAGYYDDRDYTHIKVIAMAPKEIKYSFLCVVYYPDGSVMNGNGYVRYNYATVLRWIVKHAYRNGYIICRVPKEKGRPTHVSIFKEGIMYPTTNITIFPPSETKNNITRCIRAFDRNYSNVTQLVWNIEVLRMYGVDRFVFYLWNQSKTVVDMLRSYEDDGLVELRNFTINQPGSRIDTFISRRVMWGQLSSYHDCLFSEMYSAKYIVFHDVDEAIIPKKHKTLVELGDDLFRQVEHGKRVGALRFKNTYFPLARNKTQVLYPYKDLALRYNIHPLLYTIHKRSLHPGWNAKSMVIPEAVEEMFIHYVEKLKPGWREMVVNETVGKLQHYRYTEKFPELPESPENDMLKYSPQLVSAVEQRFQRANIKP